MSLSPAQNIFTPKTKTLLFGYMLKLKNLFSICTLQNYGDESDAYGLINPSIYSNHGVHEKDFFQPRDQYEVK